MPGIVVLGIRMPRNFAAPGVALLAAAFATGSACAMTATPSAGITCRVVGQAKLPAESGGAQALCAEIETAASAQAPRATADVEVRVLSPSMLAATVTIQGGQKLPEQKYAINDRTLTRSSFERFAKAIAAEIGRASGS